MPSPRTRTPPLPTLHFELWVGYSKNRTRINRTLRRVYRIARKVTQDNGGYGPWVFLVENDPPNSKTLRLRRILGVKPNEDLWVETTFYPNKAIMKKIIRRIWAKPEFKAIANQLDGLVSRRKTGYSGTLALASLQSA